ncbi:DNA-binding protein snt1 [Basidiobolus ranarum]|uniref:DNA-binding protein snt1 n=1 Tax=Basidiobolus ranarum TaxID=34480 RepID=A0ABR2X503_9FUNG
METRHPFQTRSILPIDDKQSEYVQPEVSPSPGEDKSNRVNLENIFPAEQLNSKLPRQDPLPYQPNRGRYEPYGFSSRSSRDREDRRDREDHFRHRVDRELHRHERPSSSNSSYSFNPSYYNHNRRAGADPEELNCGTNGSPVSSTFETSRRSESTGPPPIVISRDPSSGNVLMRSGGSNFAPMDMMFPHVGEREGRPKYNEGFGNSRGRGYPSNNFDRINRAGSARESATRNHNYRDNRNGEFSYFTRNTEPRDYPSRGVGSFTGYREREWGRERSRDRDRQRWERERDRSRDWDRYRGRQRWDSERMRERDMGPNRFEHGDSYRPGDRDREYFDEDMHRREHYRDFRRESINKDAYDYYFHSRNSLTPERRSSSVESTRYLERRKSSRSEVAQCHSRPSGEFDNSKHSSYTRQNSVSTDRSYDEYYDKLNPYPEIAHGKSNNVLVPSEAVSNIEMQSKSPQSEVAGRDEKDSLKASEHIVDLLEPNPLQSLSQDELKAGAENSPQPTLDSSMLAPHRNTGSEESDEPEVAMASFEEPLSDCTNIDNGKTNRFTAVDDAPTDLDEDRVDQSCIESVSKHTLLKETHTPTESSEQCKQDDFEGSDQDIEVVSADLNVETTSCLEPDSVIEDSFDGPTRPDLKEGPNKLEIEKSRDTKPKEPIPLEVLNKDTGTVEKEEVSVVEVAKPEDEISVTDEENAPLTTEKIFAMIDHIDSEIGHYEALLTRIRKNKESCIETDALHIGNSVDPQGNLGDEKSLDYTSTKTPPEIEPAAQASNASSQPNVEAAVSLLKPKQLSKVNDESKAKKVEKPSLYQQIYAENQTLVRSHVEPFRGPVYKNIEDYPFYSENIEAHKKIRSLMFTHLQLKANSLEQKETNLRQEYKEHLDDWRIRIIKLDKSREKRRNKKYMEDELLTSNTHGISARSQRRGGFYNADAVRSEAELMEIIQYLESEDLRNPDVRSIRTAATIPAMILDPYKKELTKYDNRNNLVEDPYNYYHCDKSVDKWTKEERDIFIKKYLLYPKQFGKIASFLKNKDPKQCVLYYYREKKSIDFKGLISGRGKKARQLARKGAGKRAGRKKKSKGNSLLQDIDEAERSTQLSEEPPDSPSFSERKRSRGFDDESTLPESQKSRRKPRTKHRQNSLPDDEEENGTRTAPPHPSPSTARWSEEDRHVALQAYKKFGQDFYSVSRVVGSKTEEQCRNFYYNFRRKHGMSALEAPLEMTTEKGIDSKVVSLSNDSFSPSKPGRKHKSPVESVKSERKQQKLKRKSSEKSISETSLAQDPPIDKKSTQKRSESPRLQNLEDSPYTTKSNIPSPIKHTKFEQSKGHVTIEHLIDQGGVYHPDISKNPPYQDAHSQTLSYEATATNPERSRNDSTPHIAPAEPCESFLGLLVQAAFNQEADLSKTADMNAQSSSSPDFDLSKQTLQTFSEPVRFDPGKHHSNTTAHIPPLNTEEKAVDHSSRYLNTNSSYDSANKKFFDTQKDLQLRLSNNTPKSIAYAALDSRNPSTVATPGTHQGSFETPSVSQAEAMSRTNQHNIDAADILSLLNMASEERVDTKARKDISRNWFGGDNHLSASSALDFSQPTADKNSKLMSSTPHSEYYYVQDPYHTNVRAHSYEGTNQLQHSVQDKVAEHLQMEHKAVEQRESQPVRQLQLLQLQSPPTSTSPTLSQSMPLEMPNHQSSRVNSSHHSTNPPFPPSYDQPGHSFEIRQVARQPTLSTIPTPQSKYHIPGAPQQAPENPTSFTSNYSQSLHPPLYN